MKTSAELMADPSFAAHERETREREARERHERQLARGRPSAYREGNTRPSPQDLRDSITKGRSFAHDHEVERQTRGRDRNGSKGRISQVMSALLPKGEGNSGR